MFRFKPIATLLALTAAALSAPAASAQTYPTKSLRMVVGFPPGGSSDIAARIFAEALGRELKQTIIVENSPGAGGSVAAGAITRATPDGYTVFYATSSVVLGPLLSSQFKFDATRDFTPVALTATNPLVLVVNSQVPAKTAKEFIAWAKTQEKLNYASTGAGTMTHLPGAAFTKHFGIDALHVPYKGAAPALVDLGSGQAQFMISALSEAMPRLKDGRVRALAITSDKRSNLYPEVPTMREATGATEFVMGGWQAILLPKGAPKEAVTRLNAAVNAAVNDPQLQAKFAQHGTELLGGTPDELSQYMKSEQVRWKKIILDAGARAE